MLQRLLATFAVAMALVCSSSALAATRLPATTLTAIVSCGAAGAATINTAGADAVSFSLSGTWTGTNSFKVSADGGSTYSAASAIPLAGGTPVSSTTVNGQWQILTAGYTQVCIAFTASPTGSAVVTADLMNGGVVTVAGAPTLTKGTQSGAGFSVQNLKDAGRTTINWTLDSFATAATAETLMTVTESRNSAATSTPSSITITNGKKLRLQSFCYTAENGGSTPVVSRLKFRVRSNTAGATTTASPKQHLVTLALTNVAKQTTAACNSFPDGMEFTGDGTATIGFTVESPEFVTTTQIPVAHMAITAFEY
jgi:hypothetical protein